MCEFSGFVVAILSAPILCTCFSTPEKLQMRRAGQLQFAQPLSICS
jgi:hypothetical protein